MAVLTSQVELGTEEFSRRRVRMAALVAELRDRTAQVAPAAASRRSRGIAPAGSSPRVSGSTGSSTPAAFLELNALAA